MRRFLEPGRLRRAAPLLATAVLLGACSSQAGGGSNSAAVQLSPASGTTSSTPTWSTSTACKTGFQGSAVFREVHRDGTTTNSISSAVLGTNAPFHGTLQASIARIQAAGGIANGATQKLVIICFSGPSLTGTSNQDMGLFITYSSDGSSYTTSATAPAGS